MRAGLDLSVPIGQQAGTLITGLDCFPERGAGVGLVLYRLLTTKSCFSLSGSQRIQTAFGMDSGGGGGDVRLVSPKKIHSMVLSVNVYDESVRGRPIYCPQSLSDAQIFVVQHLNSSRGFHSLTVL